MHTPKLKLGKIQGIYGGGKGGGAVSRWDLVGNETPRQRCLTRKKVYYSKRGVIAGGENSITTLKVSTWKNGHWEATSRSYKTWQMKKYTKCGKKEGGGRK